MFLTCWKANILSYPYKLFKGQHRGIEVKELHYAEKSTDTWNRVVETEVELTGSTKELWLCSATSANLFL